MKRDLKDVCFGLAVGILLAALTCGINLDIFGAQSGSISNTNIATRTNFAAESDILLAENTNRPSPYKTVTVTVENLFTNRAAIGAQKVVASDGGTNELGSTEITGDLTVSGTISADAFNIGGTNLNAGWLTINDAFTNKAPWVFWTNDMTGAVRTFVSGRYYTNVDQRAFVSQFVELEVTTNSDIATLNLMLDEDSDGAPETIVDSVYIDGSFGALKLGTKVSAFVQPGQAFSLSNNSILNGTATMSGGKWVLQ